MSKIKLTAGRIAAFQCPDDKSQSFLWCNEVPGLGIRSTPRSSSKRYIFQAKVNRQSMRVTIGDVCVWSIAEAQAEARCLQIQIDQGNDPRQVKADIAAAKEAAFLTQKTKEAREAVTVGEAWKKYLDSRKSFWGERHHADHVEMMQLGGEKRLRSNKLTEPGILASLAAIRLIDLTPERVCEWAATEGATRAGRARLATRLLKAFLSWCTEQSAYREIVTVNAAKNKNAREILGKPKSMDDVIQREQLSAWFIAVKQIGNPVISAYLQTLLLTGARPNELTTLCWEDVDFQFGGKMTIRDKVEGMRTIPLPPYLAQLCASLPRRNKYVFSSTTSKSGHLIDPHDAHDKACTTAGVTVTLYGLRRSFATLSEWIEMPAGISAQIQGHKPSGIREKHYIRRPLDLLRQWHIKIEKWILEQANIEQPKLALRKLTAVSKV